MFVFLFSSLLISYTRDRSNPDDKWKGYVYAIAMFLVAMTISLVMHQYFQIVFVLGMKIRTAIIGMVYAKVQHVGFLIIILLLLVVSFNIMVKINQAKFIIVYVSLLISRCKVL